VDSREQAQFRQMQRALQGQLVPRTVTAAATLQLSDYLVACDATSAAFTLTLPAVKDAKGMTFLVVKTDSSANAVTIDGNASETINGATTQALSAQWAEATLYCDGTQWIAFLVGSAAAQMYTPGTFTSTIRFGGASTGIVYGNQQGNYTRLGNRCHFTIYVSMTNKGSATGSATIGGLPFTSAATYFSAFACWSNGLTGVTGAVSAYLGPSASAITLAILNNGNESAALADTHCTNTGAFLLSGHYPIA
jgi:hypothetical protein